MSFVNVWNKLDGSEWRGSSDDPLFSLDLDYTWQSAGRESSHWGTAAFEFIGNAGQRELRVVDLHTETLLATATLASNQFLIPSYDNDSLFALGRLTGSGSTRQLSINYFI
jgi:hypothetical protein